MSPFTVHYGAMNQAPPREALPDRLRGIALLGIVVVNAAYLGISLEGLTQASVEGTANLITALLVVTFAQGKFYLLFSFLFGYSASFILRDNSAPNRRRYLRRLIALFLFGLAHAVFFFVGDILITYSILGLLLFFVSRTSDKVLRRWTIAAIAVAVFLILSITALTAAFPAEGSSFGDGNRHLHAGGSRAPRGAARDCARRVSSAGSDGLRGLYSRASSITSPPAGRPGSKHRVLASHG